MTIVPPLNDSQKRAVFERDNHTCQHCGRIGEPGAHSGEVQVHHIQSRHAGSSNELDNLITLCYDCHKEADNNPGRPSIHGVKMRTNLVSMLPEYWEWCLAHDDASNGAYIRRLVLRDMQSKQGVKA